MALTITNDTAIHEAGHSIIAYLASDLLSIDFVTADKTLSNSQDSTSLGGLKASITKDLELLTFEDHDSMILICLAGMAADDVNHCNGILSDKLYNNTVFSHKIASKKYSGDSNLLIPHLQRLVPQLNIEQRPYTISCQRLLYDIFTTDWIMEILIALRNKIANSKMVTGQELIAFLDKTDLKNWKENEWGNIVTSRSTKFKKRIFWFQKFLKIFKK